MSGEEEAGVHGRSVGRPSDYCPEYCEIAANLATQGATDAEIAQVLEIAESTFYRWQAAHPEFRESVKLGKEAADERVERSLYHRAVGYSHPDVHISNFQGEVTITPIRKHYPPDTGAATMWLTNRKSADWRSKQALEHTGPNGGPIQTEEMSPSELGRRIAFALTQGLNSTDPKAK